MTPKALPKVPIPPRGVDYRGKVVLAPMVRSGELPSRLLALQYGADLVWGPETIDRAIIGSTRQVNPRTGCIEWTRAPSNGGADPETRTVETKPSVLYRIDPVRERGRLIYQMGTCKPELAVAAARLVAADVAGIDVNAGCPKSFSTDGGMGAALLKMPDRLCAILEALVCDIVPVFQIGISVKIRILANPDDTAALVRRLVRTGITGLTVHCRTTPMRPRERAIRDQLPMVAELCHEAGVACVMNGDVVSRDDALRLMAQYGVDGAMIATAAERNASCFRGAEAVAAAASEVGNGADGASGAKNTNTNGKNNGLAPWTELAENYLRHATAVENRFANTKYVLAQLVPGRYAEQIRLMQGHSYEDLCTALALEHHLEAARATDRAMGLDPASLHAAAAAKEEQQRLARQKRAAAKKAATASSVARAAGGNMAEARSAVQQQKKPLSERGIAFSATAASETSAPAQPLQAAAAQAAV